MSGCRGRGVMVALAASLAVLLPGGILAAGTVDRPASDTAADARARTAGLGLQGLDEEAVSSRSHSTVLPAAPAPSTSMPPPPAPVPTVSTRTVTGANTVSTTTIRPATSPTPTGISATTRTLVPGVPMPKPQTSWSVDQHGITVRIRMEPAAPQAGQTIRFIVDMSSVEPCCATGLSFGDGSEYAQIAPGTCASAANVTGAVASHVFASPGVYRIHFVATTLPCKVTVVDGQPVPPPIAGVGIVACIGVGLDPTELYAC